MPFDFVAEVRCFFGRLWARSKANVRTRSMPTRRHHGLLDHDLALGAGEHAAADRGVLALRVLAHDPEVDVARLLVGERAGDARHQAHRTQVDVLVELAPQWAPASPRARCGPAPCRASRPRRRRWRRGSRSGLSSLPASCGRAGGSSRRRRSRTSPARSSKPNLLAAASRTRTPSGTTSLPIPSPRDDRDAVSAFSHMRVSFLSGLLC